MAAVFETGTRARAGAGRKRTRGVRERSGERRHLLRLPPARRDPGGRCRLARRDGATARSQRRAPAGSGSRCSFDNDVPGEILFQAGGPVLFLPLHLSRRVQGEPDRHLLGRQPRRRRARARRSTVPGARRGDRDHHDQRSRHGPVRRSVRRANLAEASRPARTFDRRTVGLSATRADIQPTILSLGSRRKPRSSGDGRLRPFALCRNAFSAASPAPCWTRMTVPTLMSH